MQLHKKEAIRFVFEPQQNLGQIVGTSIQLFHTFLCNSQTILPEVLWMTRWYCCTRPKTKGNSASGHPKHCTKDVIVLIVAQKGMILLFYYPTQNLQRVIIRAIISAMLMRPQFVYDGRSWWVGSLLFVVRNIKCGYSFS